MPLNVQKVKWGHMVRPGASAGTAFGEAFGTPVRKPPAPRNNRSDDVFAAWVLGPAAQVLKRSARGGLQAVLFDLDGVLVDTAEYHYRGWKQLADELGLPFDRRMNNAFRGVGRMECLEKLLGEHSHAFVAEEKRMLAERKNANYLELVNTLTPKDVATGARGLAMGLRALSDGGVRMAVVSASKNARLVLELLNINDWFDAIIDGADVTRGKPDPQGFLLAADRLRVNATQCVVIEDAESGVRAARAAGMRCVGIGGASTSADVLASGVGDITVEVLESLASLSRGRQSQ